MPHISGQHLHKGYLLRMSEDLRKRADTAARADGRKLNNWIVRLIEREVTKMPQTEYRAACVGHCRLTGPEHQHLDDAVLLAVAVAEAERQGLFGTDQHQITAGQIRIGTWGE